MEMGTEFSVECTTTNLNRFDMHEYGAAGQRLAVQAVTRDFLPLMGFLRIHCFPLKALDLNRENDNKVQLIVDDSAIFGCFLSIQFNHHGLTRPAKQEAACLYLIPTTP